MRLARFTVLALWSALFVVSAPAAEVVIHFDDATVGKPVPAYTNNGVVFTPAYGSSYSTAIPRVMFFPHLKTDKKGILNAMANDPIPVKVKFPNGASSVTLVMWGSGASGTPAKVEAFDKDGKVVDTASLPKIPMRTSPDQPLPSFEMTVKATNIAYVCFSGPRTGEYLAAEEVRFTPLADPPK